jgi:hypothetical protein
LRGSVRLSLETGPHLPCQAANGCRRQRATRYQG